MKDLLIPLVLLLGSGTTIWFFATDHLSVSRIFAREVGPVAPAPATKPSPDAKSPKPQAKVAPNKLRESLPAAEVAPVVPEAAPATVAVAAVPSTPKEKATIRIVAPDNVRPGMDSEQVTKLLGEPDLQTSTIDHGSLRQIYVYNHTVGNKTAYIHLLDGRIQYLSSRK